MANSNSEIELGSVIENGIPDGYPRFADLIAKDKDKSTTIFRRFERLAARNLLYLEATLTELEDEQDILDQEAKNAGYDSLNYSGIKKLSALARPAPKRQPSTVPEAPSVHTPTAPEAPSQTITSLEESSHALKKLNMAIAIRQALKEYHEGLKLQSDILSLSRPARRALEGLRVKFDRVDKDFPDPDPMIGDKMETHLKENDLCVLAPPVERDRLTKFFQGPFSDWFHIFRERDDHGNPNDFVSDKQIGDAVGFISIIAATAFLVAAIWGLYAVSHPTYQLIMLTFFALCFAACIALLTNARRQDVFAVTAGYVAVLVVFISTNMAGVWAPPPAIALDITILASSTENGTKFEPSVIATANVTSLDHSSSSRTSGFIGVGITAFFALVAVIIVFVVWIFRYLHKEKSPDVRSLPQSNNASEAGSGNQEASAEV